MHHPWKYSRHILRNTISYSEKYHRILIIKIPCNDHPNAMDGCIPSTSLIHQNHPPFFSWTILWDVGCIRPFTSSERRKKDTASTFLFVECIRHTYSISTNTAVHNPIATPTMYTVIDLDFYQAKNIANQATPTHSVLFFLPIYGGTRAL